MYTEEDMVKHTENLKHWQQLGNKEKCKAIVYSQEAFEFVRDTPKDQEVIATLTFDNCTSLERRNKL